MLSERDWAEHESSVNWGYAESAVLLYPFVLHTMFLLDRIPSYELSFMYMFLISRK